MNVTFVTGSEISLGREFDRTFDDFCRKEILNGDAYREKFKIYADGLKEAIIGKEGAYTFADFEKFINDLLAGAEKVPSQGFVDFVEEFLTDMLETYYAKEPNLAPKKYNNTPKKYIKGTKEWFPECFRASLAGLFSRTVFSEVSYKHLRDECSYHMTKKEDGYMIETPPSDSNLVSKHIKYSLFNFNFGNLLWKCIFSRLEGERSYDDWTATHGIGGKTWVRKGNVVLGDFTLEDDSLYIHEDVKNMSARTGLEFSDPYDSLDKAISESHVICVYGLPMEDVAYDSIWRKIFKRLNDEHVTLVIFDFCSGYNPRRMYYKRSRVNHYVNLLDKFVDGAGGIRDYMDKIHFAYNKDIFSFDWYFMENRDWGWIYDDDMLGKLDS